MHLQAGLGAGGIAGVLNHLDHLGQVVEGLDQTLHHFQAFLAAAQGVTGAPHHRELAVLQELLEHLAQAQLDGLAIDQGQQDGAEIVLQGCAFVQLRQHLLGVGIAAQFHHHPHAFAIAFIADVRDPSNFAVVDLISQFFDPAGFAELIRQLGDHHGIALVASFAGLHLLDMGHPAHGDAAAAMEVGVAQATAGEHHTTGGEIRPRHQLQQLVVAEVGVAD